MKYGSLPPGWWLEVTDRGLYTQLTLTGPDGAGASFDCDKGAARSDVLHVLLAELAKKTP